MTLIHFTSFYIVLQSPYSFSIRFSLFCYFPVSHRKYPKISTHQPVSLCQGWPGLQHIWLPAHTNVAEHGEANKVIVTSLTNKSMISQWFISTKIFWHWCWYHIILTWISLIFNDETGDMNISQTYKEVYFERLPGLPSLMLRSASGVGCRNHLFMRFMHVDVAQTCRTWGFPTNTFITSYHCHGSFLIHSLPFQLWVAVGRVAIELKGLPGDVIAPEM